MQTPDGRKIPAIMATQHPDNAGKVEWLGREFVSVSDEIEECFRCFSDLNADEYMWDWEGKFVDEAVIEKLFRFYSDYFQANHLGKDKFLTFRIPNTDEEKTARVARAYMNILTSDDFAKSSGFYSPPVFEVILPMTQSATQLMNVHRTFDKVTKFEHEVFAHETGDISSLSVIPLFEGVQTIIKSNEILSEYVDSYVKEYGSKPKYIRPFIARSDPAMNAGLIPAEFAVRIALSKYYYKFEKETGIPVYPIIGTGSLPFRGGLNPEFVNERLRDLNGVRTVTTQSAFRYDYDDESVRKAYSILKDKLHNSIALELTDEECDYLSGVIEIASGNFKATIEELAPLINKIADSVPNRRERIQHIGLFGYSRGVGKVRLPRAIKFTSALYSIGLPPEFIGTGRALKKIHADGKLDLLNKVYVNLKADLEHAGKYLNPENVKFLIEEYPVLKDYLEDISAIEEILGVKIGPVKPHHYIHRNLASSVYWHLKDGTQMEQVLCEAGIMRKSLG